MLRFSVLGISDTEDGECILFNAIPPEKLEFEENEKWIPLLDRYPQETSPKNS
jgi:hypothetical protein